MSEFRTKFNINPSEEKLSYQTKSLFLGSCFADNLGGRLQELRFPITLNPFGVIYNPISIKNSLEVLLTNKMLKEDDLFQDKEQWHSFLFHSTFSDKDKIVCLETINAAIEKGHKELKEAKFLFITFGTSWVFEDKNSKEVVSNCHKLHAGNFERKLISKDDIIEVYRPLIEQLKSFNSNLKIVFTVSPIRHLSDGAEENQLSKSILIVATHELRKAFEGIAYFPAYEIMNDDLRDYRFYKEDMIHPSSIAIDYIFERFSNTYFSNETRLIIKEIEKINAARAHRPFNADSLEYELFKEKQKAKELDLLERYPYLNLAT